MYVEINILAFLLHLRGEPCNGASELVTTARPQLIVQGSRLFPSCLPPIARSLYLSSAALLEEAFVLAELRPRRQRTATMTICYATDRASYVMKFQQHTLGGIHVKLNRLQPGPRCNHMKVYIPVNKSASSTQLYLCMYASAAGWQHYYVAKRCAWSDRRTCLCA